MKTVILAAGYGTRLYPLTIDKPKALLEVGGKTILDRLVKKIELIKDNDEIFIVTNEKFTKSFENWVKSVKYSTKISVINDKTISNETRLGAIGDINLALNREKIDDDLLITGSDNLFELDLREFVKFSITKKPSSSMMLFDVKDIKFATKYGICALDENNKIINFEEKPAVPKSTLAATALYFIPKEIVPKIHEYMKTDLSKDAPGNLMKWLAGEDKVFGYVLESAWYDIGDIESLKKADMEFSAKEKKGED